MRVELLELFPRLAQSILLVWLPSFVILKFDLRLQDVEFLSQFLKLLVMNLAKIRKYLSANSHDTWLYDRKLETYQNFVDAHASGC